MSRKRSSTSQHGHTPFSSSATSIPPLTIADFQTSHDEPFNNYTLGNATKIRRTGSQRNQLPQVPEVAVYNNPEDWLSRIPDDVYPRSSLSFDSSPTICCSERQHDALSLSPLSDAAVAFSNIVQPSQTPSTPTTGDLSSGTTLASVMSRQDSLASSEFCYDFSDMLRVQSHVSNCSSNGGHSPVEFSPTFAKSNESDIGLSEHDHILQFTGGIVDDVHFSTSFPSAPIGDPLLNSAVQVEETGMERSRSGESNTSASSSHLRAARRRHQQIAQASRPIAPKRSEIESTVSRQSSSELKTSPIRSADGSSKNVVMIPKAPYQRPAHPRVMCTRCNDHPEGFRGEHELRRHVDRAHGIFRKVWVTVDISADKKFLAGCKSCRLGKKYGAYYNAAAHLRRAHFNPRKRGRGAKGKNEEKRGGKGGGDHPSMDILKMWMKEVEEVVVENMPPRDDDDDGVDDGTMLDESYTYLTAPPMQTTYSNASSDGSSAGQYNDTLAFDYNSSFHDAVLPPQASSDDNYDNAPMQLFHSFDADQIDSVNAFHDEPSPFIDPLYFHSVSIAGQQPYAGLTGSNLFAGLQQ